MNAIASALCLLMISCTTLHESEDGGFLGGTSDSLKPRPNSRQSQGRRIQNRAVASLISKSKQHLESGRLDQAVSSLERAYGIDYQDPEVSLMMAKALFAKGNEAQAEQWALRSVNLWGPSDSHRRRESWELISRCRIRRGDYSGANEAIKKAQEI